MPTHKTLLIFCVPLLTSCAVNFKQPSTRFMSSETTGKAWGGDVGLQLTGGANIKLIKEPTESSPSTNPNIDEAQDVGARVQLGLVSFADAYVSKTTEGPYALGLKVQGLGDSRMQAKAGGFSLSLFAGYLVASITSEKTKNSGGADEVVADSEVDVSGFEAGVSIGYRLTDGLLNYLTLYHSQLEASASLDQVDSGVRTDNLVKVDGEGTVQAISVGFIIGDKLYLQSEASYTLGKWTRTTAPEIDAQDMKNFTFGVNAGLSW